MQVIHNQCWLCCILNKHQKILVSFSGSLVMPVFKAMSIHVQQLPITVSQSCLLAGLLSMYKINRLFLIYQHLVFFIFVSYERDLPLYTRGLRCLEASEGLLIKEIGATFCFFGSNMIASTSPIPQVLQHTYGLRIPPEI